MLLRIELDRALATLSELERDALTASSTGFTTEEIGRFHGRSEQAVKSVAKRIRRRLRAVLDPALLPALGGLAWLRRRARGLNVQNGALQGDAALFLSVAVVVGMVGGIAPSQPSDDARATSAPMLARFDARADQAAERDAAPRVRSVSPPEAGGSPLAPEPEAVEVDVHQRDGAATPDRIVVQEPTVDTPLGPVGGGRTEAECAGPGFDILPRSDSLYRMC